MMSRDAWTSLSHTAVWLKYVFTAATTALTVVSLRYETTFKTDDPTARKRLTFVGGYYQAGVIFLAGITLATTIAGDLADKHVKDYEKADAAQVLDSTLQSRLEEQARTKIAPIMKVFSEQLSNTTEKVSGQVEQQGKTSLLQLKAVEDDLATQATQSSQEMSQVQASIFESSQETTRQVMEKQQNLTEANRGLLDFYLTLSFGKGAKDAQQLESWNRRAQDYILRQTEECKEVETKEGKGVWSYVCEEAVKRASQDAPLYGFSSALFSNDPEVTNTLFFLTPGFGISIMDEACEASDRRDSLIAQHIVKPATQFTPCLEVTSSLVKQSLRNGSVIAPASLTLTLEPAPTGRPSDVVIFSSLDKATRDTWALQAQDLSINELHISTCKTRHAQYQIRVDPSMMNDRLKSAVSALPKRLNVNLLKMLANPTSDLRTDPSAHIYEYRQVEGSTSLVPGGCLNTSYTTATIPGQM